MNLASHVQNRTINPNLGLIETQI